MTRVAMRMWLGGAALAVLGAGAASAWAGPPRLTLAPADDPADEPAGDLSEVEEDETPPVPGVPLTAAELGALDRMIGLQEKFLTTLERHRRDAPGAAKALAALARAEARTLAVDGRKLAEVKVRVMHDQRAALSIPDALLARIDRTAQRWNALAPDLDRLLTNDAVFEVMTKFAVPLLEP